MATQVRRKSIKDQGLSKGFSSLVDGNYTIYSGIASFAQSFKYENNEGFNGTQRRDSLSTGQNGSENTKPSQNNEDEKTANPNKDIKHLLSVYADKCSLNGVIFIKSSKYLVVKAIWALLLFVSIIVMIVHLSKLAATYYSYGKQSKVDFKFENLKFPAVTICNVNAVRQSQMHLASESLQLLVEEVSPDKMYANSGEWKPSYTGQMAAGDDENLWNMRLGRRRKKRWTKSLAKNPTANFTMKSRTNSFLDDYNYNWTKLDKLWKAVSNTDTNGDSWESESQPSAFDEITGQFISLYNQENGTIHQQMGHRIQDMLIQCSFVGRKCLQSNFSLVASSTMGNCYTIQYNKFIAKGSGPREGLVLMLNLETNEYIPGITNAKGAKIVVHEPETIPFPDDEGIAIGAGMETSIGLRRTSITRLGKPHGECEDIDSFRKMYGIKYSRQACQHICEMEDVVLACECYDAKRPFMYTLMKDHENIKPCQLDIERKFCMDAIEINYQANSSCRCSSPCHGINKEKSTGCKKWHYKCAEDEQQILSTKKHSSIKQGYRWRPTLTEEVSYKKTISSKPWPSHAFSKLMAKSVCIERPDNYLCDYPEMNEIALRENFVKVNVYFETLNYASVIEEPDYTEFQFMSDIGGTIGLYIGISVLSAFELFHLLIAILRYLILKNIDNVDDCLLKTMIMTKLQR